MKYGLLYEWPITDYCTEAEITVTQLTLGAMRKSGSLCQSSLTLFYQVTLFYQRPL